jgi:SAM-dependent methyltransferase
MEMAFHHIEPRAEVPSVLARLLRPGGHVVIAEANAWNPLLQAAFFGQRGLRTISERVDAEGRRHLYGVERITTARRIERLFSYEDFLPVSSRYFRVLPNSAFTERLAWIERWVPGWLLPAFSHYVVVLQRTGH